MLPEYTRKNLIRYGATVSREKPSRYTDLKSIIQRFISSSKIINIPTCYSRFRRRIQMENSVYQSRLRRGYYILSVEGIYAQIKISHSKLITSPVRDDEDSNKR